MSQLATASEKLSNAETFRSVHKGARIDPLDGGQAACRIEPASTESWVASTLESASIAVAASLR